MQCNLIWENEAERIVRCVVCGRSRTTRALELNRIVYICRGADGQASVAQHSILELPQPPPTLTRIKNFSKAAISHITAGQPTCTQEQIDERYAICRDCPLFISHGNSKGICSHTSCGCNITNTTVYLNKLGWADQSCPIDKWGPITTSSGNV